MILATPTGNRELRLFEAAGFIPRPGSTDAVVSHATKYTQLGIAAVANAVRLVSEEMGALVMRTYTGDGAMYRQPDYTTWQAQLFQQPRMDEAVSTFDLWSDLAATLELEEHAFLWKTRGGKPRRVLELFPVDPDFVRVQVKNGLKKITARVDGAIRDVTADVVHVRSWSPGPATTGVSTLEMHWQELKIAGAYDLYRGRYFDNNGAPGIVLEVPGSPDKQKRQDMLESWWKRHGGAVNASRPGIAWGGMKVSQLAPTLRDSQAVELDDVIGKEIGRMFRIFPLELMHAGTRITPRSASDTSDIFIRFSMLPRMRRIERALAADRDLFPDPKLYPRFDASELLRADFATSATVAKESYQSGLAMRDESRAMLGLPPLPDGKGQTFQETPVGGAANSEADQSALADLGAADD